MNDADLTRLWTTLEPNGHERARIENRVFEWLEASETSLFAEWLNLLKLDPLPCLGYAAVAALALFMLTPLGWVASAVLR
jgi:hypothetical protein